MQVKGGAVAFFGGLGQLHNTATFQMVHRMKGGWGWGEKRYHRKRRGAAFPRVYTVFRIRIRFLRNTDPDPVQCFNLVPGSKGSLFHTVNLKLTRETFLFKNPLVYSKLLVYFYIPVVPKKKKTINLIYVSMYVKNKLLERSMYIGE